MSDVRAHAWFGRQRFARLRRRIYQLTPDIPDEALPVVLATIEQAIANHGGGAVPLEVLVSAARGARGDA